MWPQVKKILFYDDNEALRKSIAAMMEVEHGTSLIAMPNAETVENDIAMLKPDIVLMDIDMPEVNGVEAVRRIRAVNAELPVIIVTVFEDNENIFNAICAGASGYILKRFINTELAAAITNVLTGGAPMTGSVARKVLKLMSGAEKEKIHLTTQEHSILQLLVKGYSYKMIAGELVIKIDTVRFHIKNIYQKLHVRSATEAVSKAIREGIVK
jgi:DNA-binding NarL/FixJ family response regulator